MNNEELARKLGHSKSSVAMQKKMLGLYQDSVPPKERLTDEHKAYIRKIWARKPRSSSRPPLDTTSIPYIVT